MQPRVREAILAAAAEQRPSAVGYVNLHNFKPFNVLLGHERGDAHLARVLRGLQAIGRAWRVAGDGFAVLGERGEGRDLAAELRGFSWRLRAVVGATEAWAFAFDDGRRVAQVPWRSFLVVCTPRCGVVEVAERAEVGAALEEAEARCEAMRRAGAAEAAGFAGLGQRPWHDEQRLAERCCPGCAAGAASLAIEEEDLGWARERCGECGARYQRSDKLWVLGEEQDAAYL